MTARGRLRRFVRLRRLEGIVRGLVALGVALGLAGCVPDRADMAITNAPMSAATEPTSEGEARGAADNSLVPQISDLIDRDSFVRPDYSTACLPLGDD